MNKIARLESKLAELRHQASITRDPEDKANLDEQIDSIQDDIDELEDAERDADDYEEMTGTTPQDLYNERNGYAIRQSEMIDQFRREI